MYVFVYVYIHIYIYIYIYSRGVGASQGVGGAGHHSPCDSNLASTSDDCSFPPLFFDFFLGKFDPVKRYILCVESGGEDAEEGGERGGEG